MGKVLIIDDENQLRGLLARIIGLEGYEVIQADSCKAGLKQVEQQNPDVIICDVQAEMYGPAWLSPQPVIGWEDSLHTGSVGWAAGNGSNAG